MAISDYEIGIPFDNYSRRDLYVPTGNLNLVSVQSSQDRTPIYPHWEDGKYNEHCACCWLGHTHSELRHDTAVARRIKELEEYNAKIRAIVDETKERIAMDIAKQHQDKIKRQNANMPAPLAAVMGGGPGRAVQSSMFNNGCDLNHNEDRPVLQAMTVQEIYKD